MMKKKYNFTSVDMTLNKVVKLDLQVKALIQDILNCKTSLEELNQLNSAGRSKLAQMKTHIEELDEYCKDVMDVQLGFELDNRKEQLANTQKSFQKANIMSMQEIEKAQKEELLRSSEEDTEVRQRKKTDKSSILNQSSGITEQLLSISRQLADTTQRSAETLDNLLISSSSVQSTQDELQNTAGTITQSGKLLKKYGRREFTDKVVIIFAFLFFIACVLYILQKRLF